MNSDPSKQFPEPVLAYLERVLIQNREPAFLVTDLSGVLIDLGGSLSVYGLQNLQTGLGLSVQVDFIEGLLPLETLELSLPCVQIRPQTFADIHIFRENDRDFILLVDVTADEVQQALLHQKANDLNILQNHHSQFLDLLCNLDMALLKQKDDMHFQLIGKPPEWIEHCGLRFSQDQNAYQVVSAMDFLYNFANFDEDSLPPGEAHHKSGPWVETDPDGNEWYFDATAINRGKDRIILIERVAPYEDARFAVLQKARERSLDYLQLARKEKALREKESRNRILLNAVPDWIFKINREGLILDLKATMGKNPSIFAEFVGQPLTEIFPEEAAAKMIECAQQALITNSLQTCIFPLGSMESNFQFEARAVAIGPDEAVLLVRDLPSQGNSK